MHNTFESQLKLLRDQHDMLLSTPNVEDSEFYNGIITRYASPIITAAHVPLEWRYDLSPERNPFLQERLGVNAVCNSGAIEWEGKIALVCRIEGVDRKSFFGVAMSPNGIENFEFIEEPCVIPETEIPDTNIYDMRLTRHEDGCVYGLFCTERKDPKAPSGDTSSAVAQCGIVRTKDLCNWERLPDLVTPSAQQRNVVLHPEFLKGQYALYTRPQDSFIDAGSGGGLGWGLTPTMDGACVEKETVIEPRVYHTIKESKNGQGPSPIKTEKGWLHLAHGVRNCAAGLRYVLYLFVTDLDDPRQIIAAPGGYFLAPEGEERVGDVSNVLFSNGWVKREDGSVLIYYASSDTRMHVATTTVDRLLDYAFNTPPDSSRSAEAVRQRIELISKNRCQ
ncbi:glycosidase [Cerasicoccus arenae]|nr:glycosidase [Cerasicoccus arenae]MBK1859268.1 glycosidase [Cerasicoccus arenae]